MKQLINNIDKVHTTELGIVRIKRNLKLETEDVVAFLKKHILSPEARIIRRGKNYYVEVLNYIITVNASSYTIITAHLIK